LTVVGAKSARLRFRRRAAPSGENSARSLAPPLPSGPASLGSGRSRRPRSRPLLDLIRENLVLLNYAGFTLRFLAYCIVTLVFSHVSTI